MFRLHTHWNQSSRGPRDSNLGCFCIRSPRTPPLSDLFLNETVAGIATLRRSRHRVIFGGKTSGVAESSEKSAAHHEAGPR